MSWQPSVKQCRRCGEEKAASEFHPRKDARDGLRSDCKECVRARVTARDAGCRESRAAYQRQHYAANREQRLAWQREYHQAHRGECLARSAARYQRRLEVEREAGTERARQWALSHPDKARAKGRRGTAKTRARRAGSPRIETVNHVTVFERDGWTCHLCGGLVDADLSQRHPLSASIDHLVPLAEGGEHTYANVKCAHLGCNARRGSHPIRRLA